MLPNSSYALATCVVAFLALYSIGLTAFLCKKQDRLDSEKMRSRIGFVINDMSVKEHRREYAIARLLLSHLRIYGLAFIITFASKLLSVQSVFIVYSSLLLITIVGIGNPYERPSI